MIRPLLALILSASGALAQQVATFAAPDVNSSSLRVATHKATNPVTPRDYLHQVTAWYFGHET
jgi:hypothetical protein